MKPALFTSLGVLAALGLAACNRSDTAPRPAQSDVAAAMPDAAATPGAQGPATAAPHAPPPAVNTLSDAHPTPAGPAGAAMNGTATNGAATNTTR